MVGPLVQRPRAARRPHYILQPVLPAGPARIRLPAEGGEPGCLPGESDQRAAHVSTGVSFHQRRADRDGDRPMNAKHQGAAKLWLLNLAANAVLLAAVYWWLTLPDAHGWQVGGS